jgi:hypothetical protein
MMGNGLELRYRYKNWLKIISSNQISHTELQSHVSLFGSLYYKMVSQRQMNDAFLVPELTPEVRMVNMPLEASDQQHRLE